VEVSSPDALAIDLTDRIDEQQAHDDIQVIMLVEPHVISVKVYRRDMHGLWYAERYDELDQSVDLPKVNSSIRLRDIYNTLEPKARPRCTWCRNRKAARNPDPARGWAPCSPC
jgi:hypothetical protein